MRLDRWNEGVDALKKLVTKFEARGIDVIRSADLKHVGTRIDDHFNSDHDGVVAKYRLTGG